MSGVVVDWNEALSQVGGDRDFLQEVLQDLMDEAKTAEQSIASGINNANFEEFMKAAHRIKGSASYLGCEALRDSALVIQMKGHEGIEHPERQPQLLEEVKSELQQFLNCVQTLEIEIKNWFSS